MNISPARGSSADQEPRGRGLLSTCANAGCATGWIRLWRSRRTPLLDGQWTCSAECMEQLVATALLRGQVEECDGRAHAHRIPLGLLLVEQGRISPEQLRQALAAQQRGREESGTAAPLGEWLVRSGVLSEAALTRTLSAQWSAPVFALEASRPEQLGAALPAFFSETLRAVPVRVAGGRLLYVAWAGRIDRSLSYAIEGICGLRVSSGIAADSGFRIAEARYLAAEAPRVRMLEAASIPALARSLTRLMESEKPVDARLRRVHRWWWLRLWRRPPAGSGLPAAGEVEDVLCTAGRPFRQPD